MTISRKELLREVNAASVRVQALRRESKTSESERGQLQARVGQLEGELAQEKAKVAKAEQDVADIKARLDALEVRP